MTPVLKLLVMRKLKRRRKRRKVRSIRKRRKRNIRKNDQSSVIKCLYWFSLIKEWSNVVCTICAVGVKSLKKRSRFTAQSGQMICLRNLRIHFWLEVTDSVLPLSVMVMNQRKEKKNPTS